MKKILSVTFLFALLISACNQDDLLQLSNSSKLLKFTASLEQNESRTYIDTNKDLHWSKDDEISLFYGNTDNQQYLFDGNTGDIKGTFSPVETTSNITNISLDKNYAVYPYSSDVEISENGVITATLPATQNYVENSFGLGANTMVAITENTEDKSLFFKNVGSYLKLQLYGTDVTVKTITLTGNNNEKLAGKATITPVYGQNPTVSMADDATENITLDCGNNGVKIGSTAETATAFWIVVPPTTFESGFAVTIMDVNDNEITKSTSNEISLARNTIIPMAAFEIESIPNNQIWYTASDAITPDSYADFGATIVSNVFDNGKGIIKFNGNVTTIGNSAFRSCTSLTNITIPNSVTTIGKHAFSGCPLESITIPNSVTTIGDFAFYGCSSIRNIVIPSNVTTIGDCTFGKCYDLSSIIVETGNPVYDSRNNCNAIIETATNTLISGCKETIIPNNITTIGDYAFTDCRDLTSIIIPDGVITIGERAFSYSGLRGIIIPNNVTTIGDCAFFNCYRLVNINIPNSVTTIGNNAFQACPLESITISANNIGDYAFNGCNSLTNITLGNNVSTINNYAFYNCTSLTKVEVKATVPPTIDANTFSGCNSNLNIYVPTGCINAYKAADYWKDLNLLEETIPNNQIWYTSSDGNVVTPHKSDVFGVTITSNTYENGKGVITFDGDVTTIGNDGFYHCSLVSITLPNNLTTIGEKAFYGCSSLRNVNISKSVTKIGMDAFGYCTSLINIIIPNSVNTIEAGVFRGCESLSNIIVEEGNSVYDSRNNCNAIVETASNTLISGCKNTIIPNNVTTIGRSAFRACSSLTNIIIPNSVNTIEYYAFGHCTSLTEITIPGSVSKIGDSAFYECSSLSIVKVEAIVPPIIEDPVDTFKNCSSELKIYVPAESLNDYKEATGWKDLNLSE